MRMTNTRAAFFVALLSSFALGDMYLHSLRGSNNRLDEQGRERNNANRLFDSQNNNRGGYNVGKMSYYVGEEVPIMWTNQHSAGKYQLEGTEFVMQYSCGSLIRDGTTTETIPDQPTNCNNFDCNTDVRYGMHETYDDYQECKQTYRNQGLFTANQNLQGNSAKYTRQNPGGTRRGYECPEERDYYPYWRPTMWKDIAVFTNDPSRCEQIQAESQNVRSRFKCVLPEEYLEAQRSNNNHHTNIIYPITQEECEAVEHIEEDIQAAFNNGTYTRESYDVPRGVWTEIPAWDIPAPECRSAITSRANHLGLVGGRTQMTHKWIVPDDVNERCVFRARYNITTADYAAWESLESIQAGVDSTANAAQSNPNPGNNPADLPIWEDFGLTREDVAGSFAGDEDESRGYVFKNNPQVDIFGPESGLDFDLKLQLAVNTAQFGRTFQDRSHVFSIRPRPDSVPADATLKLLTVSGKRGNIVQTFPGHEYFFVPEIMRLKPGEFWHPHWTGSNTNPNNNDGQGKQGTDRSNMVVMKPLDYENAKYSNFEDQFYEKYLATEENTFGALGSSYPSYVSMPDYEIPLSATEVVFEDALGGLGTRELQYLATTRRIYAKDGSRLDFGNMEELDDAGTTFDMEPQEATRVGCWNYVCTRNNNFSNRSQKGKLCVSENTINSAFVLPTETNTLQNSAGDWVMVPEGSFEEEIFMEFETILPEDATAGLDTWFDLNADLSEVAGIMPANMTTIEGQTMELELRYNKRYLGRPVVMFSSVSQAGPWEEVILEEDVAQSRRRRMQEGQEEDPDSFRTAEGAGPAQENGVIRVDFKLAPSDGAHVTHLWTTKTGFYKVHNGLDVGATIGIIASVILFLGFLAFAIYWRFKHTSKHREGHRRRQSDGIPTEVDTADIGVDLKNRQLPSASVSVI